MKTLTFVTALLACGYHVAADSNILVAVTTSSEGIRTSRTIWTDNADFAAYPRWEPSQEPPPLSVSNAVASATRWARSTFTNYSAIRVATIQLQSFQDFNGLTREQRIQAYDNRTPESTAWYYLITFDGWSKGVWNSDEDMWTAVLMTGRTKPPIRNTIDDRTSNQGVDRTVDPQTVHPSGHP